MIFAAPCAFPTLRFNALPGSELRRTVRDENDILKAVGRDRSEGF